MSMTPPTLTVGHEKNAASGKQQTKPSDTCFLLTGSQMAHTQFSAAIINLNGNVFTERQTDWSWLDILLTQTIVLRLAKWLSFFWAKIERFKFSTIFQIVTAKQVDNHVGMCLFQIILNFSCCSYNTLRNKTIIFIRTPSRKALSLAHLFSIVQHGLIASQTPDRCINGNFGGN